MGEKPNSDYSALIENNIVNPIKQKFGDVSGQISKLEKKIRLILIWLSVISVLLLANMLVGAYLLITRR